MIEAIKVVLKGIDQTELESTDGWWETSAGAEFGAKKLKYILGLLAQPAQQEPWCMKMNGCKTKCEDCPVEVAQRTWVGLTDEEIDYYIVHRFGVATKKNLVELIRLCEIKLKEKNNG